MEAVWQAAEIISIATFNRRIQRYEREFTGKKFFRFGKYQITRDGGLFENQRRAVGLRDQDVTLSLGPFQLRVERPRQGLGQLLGPEKHVVEIDTDRDCILIYAQEPPRDFVPRYARAAKNSRSASGVLLGRSSARRQAL
jgi:hypothetical protein